MEETRKALIDHFDEDVHRRLRVQLDETRQQLDRFGSMFWRLTKFVLDGKADFDDNVAAFKLSSSPIASAPPGRYHLISKNQDNVPGAFLYRLSHPLGEHVIEMGKGWHCPIAEVVFNISEHPTRISMVEALKGRSGWMTLERLLIDSFRQEEYLLFSGFDDLGNSLDQEVCEKMFACESTIRPADAPTDEATARLAKEREHHREATINRSLEANNRFYNEERDRLEKWADDMIFAAEKELKDTKAQIRALRRQARQAATVQEDHEIQLKIKELEQKQRRQRQRIFDVEDEIVNKRDKLIEALGRRLRQKTTTDSLFTIRWTVT